MLAGVENAAGKAARVRQRVLAAFLPVTAVLYLSAEALDPRGTDQVITTTAVAFRLLPIAAAHSSQLCLSGSLSVLALGGLAVSYAAIAMLVTGRGWVIATIAALLGGLGAFAEAMGATGPKVVLYMLPFAVVMILLAARIWQAAARPAPMTGTTRKPPTTTSPDTAAAPLITTPGS